MKLDLKEKIKVIVGEELYDIGPGILTSLIVIAGTIFIIVKTIKLK